MNPRIKQAVIGGILATLTMTIFMIMAPIMGIPKMDIPRMLSNMMRVSIILGWIMHFMIGITFAIIYALLFVKFLKNIRGNVLKGIVFGIVAFVFAQIALAIMSFIFGDTPAPEGNMVLMMIGSIMGHIVFGIVVALSIRVQVEHKSASN